MLYLTILLLCPACGELREAEPVSKTVPAAVAVVATVLLVAFVVMRSTVWRWRDGRGGTAPPCRYPRTTVALTLAPVAVLTGLVSGVLSWEVAFGYREAHVDLLGWEETLVFTVILTAGGLLALTGSAVVGLGLISRHRRERIASRTTLGVVIVGTSLVMPGAGVAWVPAAVAASLTDPRRLRARTATGSASGNVPRETFLRGSVGTITPRDECST